MRICIFSHTFPRFPGDTATPFMENLAKAFGELGHEVYVLVPFDPEIRTQYRELYRLVTYKYIFPNRLHILGYSRTFRAEKTIGPVTYLIAPFMYLFGFIALLRLVKKEKIDIINPHWLIPNGFIAHFVKLVTKVPYVASIPGADVHMGGENQIFRQMVGIACRAADYVVSDSSHYIDQLNELGFYPEKVDIIRYGVNTKTFRPTIKDMGILKSIGLNKSDPIVLAVGRMVAQKGFIYLVRAFYLVAKIIPKAKLVFVGDGYEKPRLESEVKRLKIEGNVIFAGTIPYDKLSKYYNIADVFVMPSIRDEEGNIDASPVAMMEAMSCGILVVATRFSGSEDLGLKGKTGFLVKEKDSRQIADAVLQLLASRQRREDIQAKVRIIAEKNFSIQSVSKKYIEIFKRVVNGQRSNTT